METLAHAQLKRLAAAYLLRHGCQAVAMEVRCPIGRWRADVAGYIDAASLGPGVNHLKRWAEPQAELAFDASAEKKVVRERVPPRTIIIECKQSKSDFQRDAEKRERLLRLREEALRRLQRLESIVKNAEPELKSSGTFLFGAMEEWDLSRAKGKGYRAGLERVGRIEARLYGNTKFWSLARYRQADRLYLMAPAGLVDKKHVPIGWGLLECPAKWRSLEKASMVELSEIPVRVAVEAPEQGSLEKYRDRLLRSIAVTLTRGSILGNNLAGGRRGAPRYTLRP